MFRKDHAGSASTAQRVAPGAESSEANSGEEKLSGDELPLWKDLPLSFIVFLIISSADSLPERLLSGCLLRFLPTMEGGVFCGWESGNPALVAD